jgi:hypothetical protein
VAQPSTNGFVVNHHKPSVQTAVVSRYSALAPVHDFVLLFLPPCGSHLIPFGHRVHRVEPTCLSTPRRTRKNKTFHVRSSPAATQIKPQHAPAILRQELVNTTLSITHHTKERPSNGPGTLRSSLCQEGIQRSMHPRGGADDHGAHRSNWVHNHEIEQQGRRKLM